MRVVYYGRLRGASCAAGRHSNLSVMFSDFPVDDSATRLNRSLHFVYATVATPNDVVSARLYTTATGNYILSYFALTMVLVDLFDRRHTLL